MQKQAQANIYLSALRIDMLGINGLDERLNNLDSQMQSMVDSLGEVVELLRDTNEKLTAFLESATIEEQGPLE